MKALMRAGLEPGGRKDVRRGALQSLLREAKAVDSRSVAGLQELVRGRAASG